MVHPITTYYKAWETNDKELLKTVLSPSIFGIRTYNEDKYFSNEEFLSHFTGYQSVEILSQETNKEITTLDLLINNDPVTAKITVKEGKIYKVYETIKTDKRRIKLTISYDGSSYSGYQKQPNVSTIQETIEEALKNFFKEDIIIHSSGRTDKGVHAKNQVLHFDTNSKIEASKLQMILNTYLPDSIFIKTSEEVAPTFHSRYDIKTKEYVYKINLEEFDPIQRNYEWYVPNLNLKTFQEELNRVKGTHDFTSFTKTTDQNTVRTIYRVQTQQINQYLYVTIQGNGFLRYMVRNIIGALVSISKKKLHYTMKQLLNSKDVNLIKDKAPACGLYLNKVEYEE